MIYLIWIEFKTIILQSWKITEILQSWINAWTILICLFIFSKWAEEGSETVVPVFSHIFMHQNAGWVSVKWMHFSWVSVFERPPTMWVQTGSTSGTWACRLGKWSRLQSTSAGYPLFRRKYKHCAWRLNTQLRSCTDVCRYLLTCRRAPWQLTPTLYKWHWVTFVHQLIPDFDSYLGWYRPGSSMLYRRLVPRVLADSAKICFQLSPFHRSEPAPGDNAASYRTPSTGGI